MRFTLILFSLVLASCSSLLTPYKMEIRQGNYVTAEMRAQLKIGMSKQQVLYILGTPIVHDAFHDNRWDYVYRLEQKGEAVEKQDMTLFFEGENLVRVIDGNTAEEAAPVRADEQSRG